MIKEVIIILNDTICNLTLFSYRDNLLQIRVYYETLVTKKEEQILEFTQDDLIGKFSN